MAKCRRICGEMEGQKSLRTANLVNQSCLMNLPTAVLHEILFKLPVNSLMQMKLVCRSLYKLVSDPDFSINYSKMSPFFSVLLFDYHRSFISRYPILRFKLLEIYNDVEHYTTTFEPKIPNWPRRGSTLSLAHTSDGLLCLSLVKPQVEIAYICNPITGDCIALPEHRMNRKQNYSAEYGFGFCKSTNSYKVLRVVSKSDRMPLTGKGEILTIGVDNKWRVLPYPMSPSPIVKTEFFTLNGVLHWITMDTTSAYICTFDLGEEILGRIPPPRGSLMNYLKTQLTMLNDQLCIVDSYDSSRIVIWTMEEYAVADSWTKAIVIEHPFPLHFENLVPVAVLQNEDTLFCHSSRSLPGHIISCNLIKRILMEFPDHCEGSRVYTPRLLSLNEFVMGRNGNV